MQEQYGYQQQNQPSSNYSAPQQQGQFGQKPMVNLQVYQPPRPQSQKMMDASTFMPIASGGPFFPPQWGYNYAVPPYMMGNMPYNMPNIPIVKNYTINTSGPTDDHIKLSMVYEDVLPNKEINATANTIAERISIYNYLRSTMFSNGDGTEKNLSANGKNSILSQIKFMDLNPYSSYKFSNNPYQGLPDGFLIYRSCYPIRHDANTSSVSCARGSLGMNVRIYRMTDEEYNVNTTQGKKHTDYNTWREVYYYTYIREQIIKNKVSPNFVSMFGYYLVDKSNIDFGKVHKLNGNLKDPRLKNLVYDNPRRLISSNNKNMVNRQYLPQNINNMTNNKNNMTNKTDKKDINDFSNTFEQAKPTLDEIDPVTGQKIVERILNNNVYTGKVLVALTESPVYNLYNWASKTYVRQGNVKSMITSGYHHENVWYSILFQIMVALYVMQKHKISFNNFNPEENIFIKDLSLHENSTSYWKYIINGVEYYIPNFGYLVMIDTSFKDLDNNLDIKKIIGAPFVDDSTQNSQEMQNIENNIFNMFKKTFNSNIFGKDFQTAGGVKPSDIIINLINNINKKAMADTKKDIGLYFEEFMAKYVNNRAGTYLKENERNYVRRNESGDFVKGQIVVEQQGADTYKFVVYLGDIEGKQGFVKVLSRANPNSEITVQEKNRTQLFGYSKSEPIIQNMKPNETSLSEEFLMETYYPSS